MSDADPLGWQAIVRAQRAHQSKYDDIVTDTFRRLFTIQPHTLTDTEPEEVPMPSTIGPIAGRIARLERELNELRTRVTKYGDDDYADGTVLAWEKQFSGNTRIYSYVAIKTSVGWVVSCANGSGRTYSWDNLIDHILKDAHTAPELWVASEWTAVDGEG